MQHFVGNFNLLPAPQFAPTDPIDGLSQEEVNQAFLEATLRGERQLARKFANLFWFLDDVNRQLQSGAFLPNLSRNGNFSGQQEYSDPPDFWAAYPVGGGEPACSLLAPPAIPNNVPGNAIQINIIGGGGQPAQGIQQRVQVSNRKALTPSFYYKTVSSTQGARVTLEETAGSTTVTRDLPATGGQWRYWPAAGDAPASIAAGDGAASPFVWIKLGSVAAPTVTQAISFAGVSMTEGGQPSLWKPGTLDQAQCQGEHVPTTWKTRNRVVTDIADGMAVAGPSMAPMMGFTTGVYPANNANYQGRCIGLANEDIAAGVRGRLLDSGLKEKADWTSVVGSASLAAGSRYFLSTNGLMTTTPDTVSDGSKILQCLGEAISPKKFWFYRGPVYLL